MTIEEMHFDFSLAADKVASNQIKDFSDLEIDRMLNRAIYELVEILYSGQNAKRYKLGFEVTQQRIDMLQAIHTDGMATPAHHPTHSTYDLPTDYLHLTRLYFNVPNCSGIVKGVPEQTADMNSVIVDYHRGPSLQWRRVPYQIRGGRIFAWHNGLFETGDANLEYIRKPAYVTVGGYEDAQGQTYQRTDCDLDEICHPLIIDIAVQELARSLQYGDLHQLRDVALNNVIQ